MITLIGAKRLMIIAVLFVLCGLMGAGTYLYLIPKNQALKQQLTQIRSDISFKRSEANRFREEMAEIQSEKNVFKSMQSTGFLGEQSRLEARKRIVAIQSYSRVLSARYNIQPGVVENAETAVNADRVILKTQLSFDVDAMDDADIFNFIYLMENAFMGHISVTSFELDRVLDVNEVTLRQIGSGTPMILVKAKILFDWKTLMSREQAALIGAGTAPAGEL